MIMKTTYSKEKYDYYQIQKLKEYKCNNKMYKNIGYKVTKKTK